MMEFFKDIGYWFKEKINWTFIWKLLLGFFVLLIISFPIRMFLVHNIDQKTDFGPKEVMGGSYAVAMAAALVDREVNQNDWVSNDPWFKPGAWLDNMQNYQQGIVAATARFSYELVDQLGRTRGSSKADAALQEVSGLLQYPGDKWVWDPATSFAFTATSEQQYRRALKLLREYNLRLAAGDAIFERRADNLLSTLDRIALDLGSSSAAIADQVETGSGCLFDTEADDLFYNVKGLTYGYGMILKGLRKDFQKVVNDRDLVTIWAEMEISFEALNKLDPLIISNCDVDGTIFHNHLVSSGFYLLRARTQLREITNILLK